MKQSPLLWGGAILLAIFAVPFVAVMILIAGIDFSKHPWAITDHIPETIVVLETLDDTAGMDAMYLLKGRFSTEAEISEICNEFQLLPDQEDVSPLSFAGLHDERSDIPWFPLSNTTRRYAYCSVKPDGMWKEDATGRYVNVLWIDDDTKEFIIQVAGM